MMPTKKTVLFIVEGSSDKNALEKIFRAIYRNDRNIDFRFTSGDISSDMNISVNKTSSEKYVLNKIYGYVDEFIKDKKLKKSDIFQIVQLFDMDGAYIPQTAIFPGTTTEISYSLQGIICCDKTKVIERNEHKKEVMDYLLNIKSIKGIPYEMYFMSCNLDHALYNIMNLSSDKKMEYADAFYERFIGKERVFIDYLKSDVVNGVPGFYLDSWKYIREESLRSVERHTNLHVYFKDHPCVSGLL